MEQQLTVANRGLDRIVEFTFVASFVEKQSLDLKRCEDGVILHSPDFAFAFHDYLQEGFLKIRIVELRTGSYASGVELVGFCLESKRMAIEELKLSEAARSMAGELFISNNARKGQDLQNAFQAFELLFAQIQKEGLASLQLFDDRGLKLGGIARKLDEKSIASYTRCIAAATPVEPHRVA